MNAQRILTPFVLVSLVLVVAACVPSTTTETKPTAMTAPSMEPAPSTPEPAATAVATLVKPITVTAPAAGPASSTRVPTATALPASEEEDCMGACHEIDINELFGAGVKPQPASHKGRTTCLECHAALAKPALPSTHVGRLDAACSGCHRAS